MHENLSIPSTNSQSRQSRKGVAILRLWRGLVAVPTETVYGLAGRCDEPRRRNAMLRAKVATQ